MATGLASSGSALAHIERTFLIEGIMKSYDEKSAVIINGKSSIRVPAAMIKMHRIQNGQYVSINVDIADFLELNKELLAKHGIKLESSPVAKSSPEIDAKNSNSR
jgi:hypothetical protein